MYTTYSLLFAEYYNPRALALVTTNCSFELQGSVDCDYTICVWELIKQERSGPGVIEGRGLVFVFAQTI